MAVNIFSSECLPPTNRPSFRSFSTDVRIAASIRCRSSGCAYPRTLNRPSRASRALGTGALSMALTWMGTSDLRISQRWSAGRAAMTSSTFSGMPKSPKAAAASARRPGATPELRSASSILGGPFWVPFHCSIFSELTLSQAANPRSRIPSRGRMARDVIHPAIFGSSNLRSRPHRLWPKPTATG